MVDDILDGSVELTTSMMWEIRKHDPGDYGTQ